MMASGAASCGLVGLRMLISSKVCTMYTPSRLPAPPAHFTQRRSSCKAGADHEARWTGALGGEGSEIEDLESREEDVDMRWWRAWRRLGELERRLRGLGMGDGYGRQGEREARWGSWGEGEVDMGRQWHVWWRPGERERQDQGPGGSWWPLGERERHEWAAETRWRCGERERWRWVRRAGGGAGAPPSAGPGLVAGRVGPVRRYRRVLGGLAWCRLVLEGGESPALH